MRALGPGIGGAVISGLAPLAAGALFVANNDLPRSLASRGTRLSIGVALAVTLALLADRVALHRPPWAWVRSLPWTSRRRVVNDAILLGALCAPAWICALALDARSALVALAILPLAAVRAAGAIRAGREGRTAASGRILIEQGLAAAVFGLTPWVAPAAIGLLPWALRAAAEREASSRVTRWQPLHHRAVGDAASWRGE
jgi:hypothetical protein